MSESEKKYIDITPTWSQILYLLVEVSVNGETLESRNNAYAELKRMANLADRYVAEHKKES